MVLLSLGHRQVGKNRGLESRGGSRSGLLVSMLLDLPVPALAVPVSRQGSHLSR